MFYVSTSPKLSIVVPKKHYENGHAPLPLRHYTLSLQFILICSSVTYEFSVRMSPYLHKFLMTLYIHNNSNVSLYYGHTRNTYLVIPLTSKGDLYLHVNRSKFEIWDP